MISSTAPPMGYFFALRRSPKQGAGQHIGFHVDLPRRHQVVQDGGVGIKRNILECAGNSELRPPIGRHVRDVDAGKQDSPTLRCIEAIDAVNQAGFASAVRAR